VGLCSTPAPAPIIIKKSSRISLPLLAVSRHFCSELQKIKEVRNATTKKKTRTSNAYLEHNNQSIVDH
jgi:hypothetical protein